MLSKISFLILPLLFSACATLSLILYPNSPYAEDDYVATDRDTITVDVLANDHLPHGGRIIRLPRLANGKLEKVSDSTVKYIADKKGRGEQKFSYSLVDENQKESKADVNVMLLPAQIESLIIKIDAGSYEKSDEEFFRIIVYTEEEILLDREIGVDEKWDKNHLEKLNVRLLRNEPLNDSTNIRMKLIKRYKDYKSTLKEWNLYVEAKGKLTDNREVLLLPRTARSANSDARMESEEWSLRKRKEPPKQVEKLDSDFYVISAIKSIAGEKPSSELFDFNIKGTFSRKFFATFAFDLNFDSLKTSSPVSRTAVLNEGTFAFNYTFFKPEQHAVVMYAGVLGKVFNAEPFLGFQLGALALDGVIFTSYVSFAFLYRAYEDNRIRFEPVKDHPGKYEQQGIFLRNFYVEFALYSKELPIISNLRIKGGILFPWSNASEAEIKVNNTELIGTKSKILTRIVVEVPIGKIFQY